MSKQANKTVIGIFVVVAIGLAVVAVIVFGSGKFFQTLDKRVIFFEGSVKGLNVGSPVMFRGVKVGEVDNINLYFDREKLDFMIPVIISLYPEQAKGMVTAASRKVAKEMFEEMIQRGLRAQLQMQSLVTGQLLIQLDYFPAKPANFVGAETLKLGEDVWEIPSVPTDIQEIQRKIESLPLDQIVEDVRQSLTGISEIVNSPVVKETMLYLKQTMQEVRDMVSHMDEKIDPLFSATGDTIKDAQNLVQNINSQVAPLADGINKTSDLAQAVLNDTRKLVKNVDGRITKLATGMAGTIDATRLAVQQAQMTLETLQGATVEGSPLRYEISNTLAELAGAARSLRLLANYLERNPDALLRGKVETGGK